MNQRLTELEIRYSFQSRQVEELNQVICDQQRTIDRLVQRVERLERHLSEIFEAVGPNPPNERPPHY